MEIGRKRLLFYHEGHREDKRLTANNLKYIQSPFQGWRQEARCVFMLQYL